MYDHPKDFDTETHIRSLCLEKAIELAKHRSSKEDGTDMSDNDVREAAEKFEEFIDG